MVKKCYSVTLPFENTFWYNVPHLSLVLHSSVKDFLDNTFLEQKLF